MRISNNVILTVRSMTVRHYLLCVLFVSCALASRRAWSQVRSVPVTEICSIAGSPASFDGKVVRVKGDVFSDGEHSTIVFDKSCEQFAMHLFLDSGAIGGDKLEAALTWCHRGTRGKLIRGEFTGIFHFKPGNPTEHNMGVQRIDDLVLKSTKTVSATYPRPCPEAPPLDTLVHEGDRADPSKPQ
jgi:hypothetical protein